VFEMNDDTSDQTVAQQTPGAHGAPGGRTTGGDAANGQGGAGAQPAPAQAREHDTPATAGPGGPAEDGGAAELEGDLDELVRTAAQRDEYLALAQRTQADFENYRKRVARDAALAQERGVAKLVKELLPALDNLDRALDDDGVAARGEDDAFVAGMRLVRGELAGALARMGVESFSPVGEPFDPALHEAMAQQPVAGAASGTVAEVYQPGYRLGDQVIRAARVVVVA
jgi:molecular chaperone GrpE